MFLTHAGYPDPREVPVGSEGERKIGDSFGKIAGGGVLRPLRCGTNLG
jgi:hypothetical protein